MENDGSTSGRRLRPLVHPYARTTTGVPLASNSHHQHNSRRCPFQRESATAAAHFSSQVGPGCQAQMPLSPATHASAGGAGAGVGLGGSISMDIVSGSGCTATFHSSLDTGLPASTSFIDLQAASSSSLSTPPPVCQLPPLPPSLGGPPLLQTATAVHLSGQVYSSGSSSMWMHQPYSSGNTGLTQPPWTPVPSSNSLPDPLTPVPSSNTSQLGKNTITSGGSSSVCMHQPAYSSINMVGGSKQNLVSSPATGWRSGAPGSSIKYKEDVNGPFVPTYADGLFTQNDIDKIDVDKDLKDIVDTNPKKVRSILNRRRSAARSVKKKAAYLSDLEHKVEQLQQEKKILSEQVNSQQSTTLALRAEKNEMMIKLHGFEQKKQLMNAVNETLYAEVCRLKLAAGEIWCSHVSNSSYQEMSPQTMQQENLQLQDPEIAQFLQELEEQPELDDLLV